MKNIFGIYTVIIGFLWGCSGELFLDKSKQNTPQTTEQSSDDNKVCQQGNDCCKPEEMICTGNADSPGLCQCDKSWVCDAVVNPQKCEQKPFISPDGNGGWTCEVVETMERCVRSGDENLTGKGGWTCTTNNNSIICTRELNTPDGNGNWNCQYTESGKTCEKIIPPPTTTDGGTPSIPTGGGNWVCTESLEEGIVCQQTQSEFPLSGNGNWTCQWNETSIICKGSSTTPPGNGSWTCTVGEGVNNWICTKPRNPDDVPPGSGEWNCQYNPTEGKSVCTQPPVKPNPSAVCIPNQRRWCQDVEASCSCEYGMQVCKPDGTWDKCIGMKGKKPNTECACHYNTFMSQCCERSDCIVPEGTEGRVCPPSGGAYCDYCSLLTADCQSGLMCLQFPTANKEVFCALDCAATKQCPTGSTCKSLQYGGVSRWFCIPDSGKCYNL